MAATIVDPAQEKESHEGVVDNTESDHQTELYDTVEMSEEDSITSPEPEAEEVGDLPEKYRGKTVAEIAKMHSEVEAALGRQSNEVGELRAAFDEFVTSSVAAKDEAPAEEVDFFLDPDKAMERAIANHPKLKQAEAVTAEMAKQSSLNKLQTNFPEMKKTLGDPAFIEWVKASPVRQRLYSAADRSYDYDSAAELLNNWGDRRTVVEETKKVERKQQSQDVKKASTGSSRSNPDARRTKKVFRRSDIIKLMKTDPDRYEAIQPELLQAYAEGRVK